MAKKEMKWRDAIIKVLRDTKGAMHYKDIADVIISKKLRANVGATPAATVYVVIVDSINKEEESPFQKVGKGLFIFKETNKEIKKDQGGKVKAKVVEEVEEEQYDVVTSFGMFWGRDSVAWTSNAKLLGMQQIGAEPVDFHKQVGIYLLYDGREIIYVGRIIDQPLGKRLYQHTQDRLSSRWDRFSWFGLLPVSDKGAIGKMPVNYDAMKVIPAMEAILIEALEPRQNRRRGDDLSAVEYIQREDPEIRKKMIKQSMEIALSKL